MNNVDRRVLIKAVNYNLDDLPTRQKKKKVYSLNSTLKITLEINFVDN